MEPIKSSLITSLNFLISIDFLLISINQCHGLASIVHLHHEQLDFFGNRSEGHLDGSFAMQIHRARQFDYRQRKFCYEQRVLDGDHHPRSPPPPPSTFPGNADFIEHYISKLATLAGIAIKYGVEVVDIKKINGLATDIQIFSLRSIQIPLPKKHPPSPCFSIFHDSETLGLSPNNSNQKTSFNWSSDFLDSFHSSRPKASTHMISAVMSSLQCYYGLKFDKQNTTTRGYTDIANGYFLGLSPTSSPPLSQYQKSKSTANGFLNKNIDGVQSDTIDKLVRRCQTFGADVTSHHSTGTSELLLREDNTTTGVFLAITSKCLPLRSNLKATSGFNQTLIAPTDDFLTNEMSDSDIQKCPSIPSLQDEESNNLASLWVASRWPDLQVLSTAAITRPIFDGIQKPIIVWRNKTAVD